MKTLALIIFGLLLFTTISLTTADNDDDDIDDYYEELEYPFPVNEAAPLANEAAPLANEEAPLANEAAPLANEAAPLANEAAPLANEAAPLANEEALFNNLPSADESQAEDKVFDIRQYNEDDTDENAQELENRRWVDKCDEHKCNSLCKVLKKSPGGTCGKLGKCYCKKKPNKKPNSKP